MMKDIDIFTDGSCLGNPGIGGWAYILKYKDHIKKESGACKDTTNNQMELTAIIKALKALKTPCNINLYTDSNLMVQSINLWLEGWIKNNFKGKKNINLWKEYIDISKDHKIKAIWIKAHNGHKENEECDKMAREAALNLQKELK